MISFFDVFDTVAMRRGGGPDSVLWLTARELLKSGLTKVPPIVFAKLRRQAEARLYARKGSGPGTTIEEIYEELATVGAIVRNGPAQAVEVENRVELEQCVSVPGMRERLDAARQAGGVVFVSDMYLRESTVRAILDKCGVLMPKDRIYVSSEVKLWKKDGRLFEYALSSIGASRDEVRHFGNDRCSDISGAKKAGVAAEFLSEANLNCREEFWDKQGPDSCGLGSALAGASRSVRIKGKRNGCSNCELVEVAASVAAPTLIVFVLWVLQKAKADGVKKLFFLARDGQILLKVAEILARRCGIKLEVEYLHASRQSWFLASLYAVEEKPFNWVLRSARSLTIQEFFAVIGLDADEANRVPVRHRLDVIAMENGQWTEQGSALLEDQLFREYIVQIAEGRRRVLRQYFAEKGIVEGADIALVDLGWSGSIQRMGQAISGLSTLPAYYLGLRSADSPQGAVAYLNSLFQPHLESVVPLIEGFCFADHPSVVGFSDETPTVPIYADSIATELICAWGLCEFQAAIVGVAETMQLDEEMSSGVTSMQSPLLKFLIHVNQTPTFAEAKVFCFQPWEDGVGAFAVSLPRGKRLTVIDMLKIILRLDSQDVGRARWTHGSVRLSGPMVRWTWAILKFLKKVKNRLSYV